MSQLRKGGAYLAMARVASDRDDRPRRTGAFVMLPGLAPWNAYAKLLYCLQGLKGSCIGLDLPKFITFHLP